MGGIWMANRSLLNSCAELVGFKSGLVLSVDRLLGLIADFRPELAERLAPPDGGGRIDSTEYEDLVAYVLYRLGRLASPRPGFPGADVYHRFKADPLAGPLIEPVWEMFLAYCEEDGAFLAAGGEQGPHPFLVEAHARFGDRGAEVALECLQATARNNQRNPWGDVRQVEWREIRDLEDLFASEGLQSQHGRYFDQRFIDYLAQNFDQIDHIHWRQFEGATAEYFERQGFHVELGPGRNDDGVDLRIFPAEPSPDTPPLIIVQCKRQKRKIDKLLVKGVHADVAYEKAGSGLIVTTSELSRGAEALRLARAYRVEAVDRQALRRWIDEMRHAPL